MELHKNWLIKVKVIGECDDILKLKQTCARPDSETAIPIQSTLLMLSSSWLASGKLLILSFSVTNDTQRRISMTKIPGPGPKDLKKCEINTQSLLMTFVMTGHGAARLFTPLRSPVPCRAITQTKQMLFLLNNLRIDVCACQKRQSRVRFWALVVIYDESQTRINYNESP